MATTEGVNVKALYSRAMALMGEGADEKALGLLAQIAAQRPNIPEVQFQIARIFLRNDDLEKALNHVCAASALRPGVPDIWKVYADVVRTLSDKGQQRIFLDALRAAPLDRRVVEQLAASVEFVTTAVTPLGSASPEAVREVVAALNRGEVVEAETRADAELRRAPDSAGLHTLRGIALLEQGRPDAAEAAAAEALRLDATLPDAQATRVRALVAMRRKEALAICNQALRMQPGSPSLLRARSECLTALGRPKQALEDLVRVVANEPDRAENHALLARFYFDDRKYPEAERVCRTAMAQGHDVYGLYVVRAMSLAELGEDSEALACLEAANERYPGHANVLVRIADLKQTLGDFEESETRFREAIAANPRRGETYRVFLLSQKLAPGDPLIEEMKAHFADTTINGKSRSNFGFALAKTMEDHKRHDEVFRYLDPANALMREAFPYDVGERVTHTDKLIASYRTVDWANVRLSGKSAFAPIFVTGMPRSGTTLVEQIISSHSTVSGAGEVGVAPGSAQQILGHEGGPYRDMSAIPQRVLDDFGSAYRTHIRGLLPDAERVTDKSIQSFAYIGFLKLAMPQARFVVVRRDPRDNLLSIYKNVFPEGTHGYAYNVEDLAEYYRQFVRTVDYWREVAPDWFYEVQYEDLVANPAEEVPKLIAACGLDWEDACLEFHKNDRRVKTLSVYQVRQPMYKSSTRAWERYGKDIRPLLDALGPEYSDAAE